MGNKRRSHGHQQKRRPARAGHAPPPLAPLVREQKPPVQYGKPFTLLEDESKQTFQFNGGSWVPFEMSIAECREQCQVERLPQMVNGMTRYQVRCPVAR